MKDLFALYSNLPVMQRSKIVVSELMLSQRKLHKFLIVKNESRKRGFWIRSLRASSDANPAITFDARIGRIGYR